jgi:ribonuclease HII
MHIAISKLNPRPQHLLVDGPSFKSYSRPTPTGFIVIPNTCIEGGDNKYTSIAAASIVAKVERDKYIEDMCKAYPYLQEWDIHNNKGYGTRKHMEAISNKGITQWHRRSFGICKTFAQE